MTYFVSVDVERATRSVFGQEFRRLATARAAFMAQCGRYVGDPDACVMLVQCHRPGARSGIVLASKSTDATRVDLSRGYFGEG